MKNLNEQPNEEPKLSLRERLEQWKQKRAGETPKKPLPNPDKPVKFEEMLRDNKPLPNQPKSSIKRLSSQSPSCTTSVRKLSDSSDFDSRMPFTLNPKLSESHRKDLERTLSLSNLTKTSQTPKRFKAPETSFFTRSIKIGDSRPGTCQKLSNKQENFKGSSNKGSLFSKDPFKGLDLNRSLSLRSNNNKNKKTPLKEVKRAGFNEPARVSKFDVSEDMFWERKPVEMEKEVDQFKMLCEDEEDKKGFESFLPEDRHLEVDLQTPQKTHEVPAAISMEKPRGNVDEFLWSSNIELEEEEQVEHSEPAESTEPTEPREPIEPVRKEEQQAAGVENKEQNFFVEDTKMNEEIEEVSEEIQKEVNKETHINEEALERLHTDMNEEVDEAVNEVAHEEEINEKVDTEINKEKVNEEAHQEAEEEKVVQEEQQIVEKILEPERIEEGLTNTRENSSNLIFEPSNDRIEPGNEAGKGSSRTASTTPAKFAENFETSSFINKEEKTAQNNESQNDEKSSLPINLELTQDHQENHEEKNLEITLTTTTSEIKEQEEIIPAPATAMLEEKEEETETIIPREITQEIPPYIPSIFAEPEPVRQGNIQKSPAKKMQEEFHPEPIEVPQQMTKSMAKSTTKKRKRSEIEVLFEQAHEFNRKENLKKVHLTVNNGREKAFANPEEKIKVELPHRSKGKASTNKKTIPESPAPAISAAKMIDDFGSELIFSIVNVKGKQGVEQTVTPVRRSMRLGSCSKSQVPLINSQSGFKNKLNLSYSNSFSVSKENMKFIDDILKAPSNNIADIIRAVDEGTSQIKELTKGNKGLVSCSKSSANKCSIPMFKDLE